MHYPSSPNKTKANQANAQKSTGPATPEGKATSSRNAVTHGLTAAQAVVPSGEKEIYEQFVTDLTAELHPQGALESVLFEQFVRAAWNLRRIAQAESILAAQSGHDPLISDDPIIYVKYQRLLRYRASTQSQYNRAFRELKSLQQNRLARSENPAIFAPSFPILANATAYLRAMTKRTQPPVPPTAPAPNPAGLSVVV